MVTTARFLAIGMFELYRICSTGLFLFFEIYFSARYNPS